MESRSHTLDRLRKETYDLLVIGGGITGCGIALDAVTRGLRVALLEKNDFASGTSSKSTKLIHGGLRYLKQLEFGLVREVGSERAVLHALAPHLVVPEKMLLPLYEHHGLGYWLTSIGLKIYDWLAGVTPEDRRRMLTRRQTIRVEPLLGNTDVKGGALYAEYRTDDARLTIEIIKTAIRHGAVALNYVQVTDFLKEGDEIRGVVASDVETGAELNVKAEVVVNAAGPWVDELRKADHSLTGKRLHLSKGVHIVVDREKFPVSQAIYFDVVDDNRMIFAIPRGRVTYIGTTDTSYYDSQDAVHTTLADAEYLIRAVNNSFPGIALSVSDVESSWAGLRPLIHEDGKSPSDLSRKDEIFISGSGLISIAGGKLTGYRKMAERVVDLVARKHFADRPLNPSITARLRLATDETTGAFFDVQNVFSALQKKMRSYRFSPYVVRQLFENFGYASLEIVQSFEKMRDGSDDQLSLITSELQFCLNHEMIRSGADFFVRRTGLLFFDIRQVVTYYQPVLEVMKNALGWSDEVYAREIYLMERLLAEAQLKESGVGSTAR